MPRLEAMRKRGNVHEVPSGGRVAFDERVVKLLSDVTFPLLCRQRDRLRAAA